MPKKLSAVALNDEALPLDYAANLAAPTVGKIGAFMLGGYDVSPLLLGGDPTRRSVPTVNDHVARHSPIDQPDRQVSLAAIAYDFQLIAEVPELSFDVAVDLIVTDTRVIRAG